MLRGIVHVLRRYFAWLALMVVWTPLNALGEAPELPPKLSCQAVQTAGFHDYPHNEEAYEAVVFYESEFRLEVNRVLMKHLLADSPFDAFLTLFDDERVVELQCANLRGAGSAKGLSCVNAPPSDLLLLNLDNLRFTRTAIGGWTFTGAGETSAGESIYVEYGQCEEG